VRGFLGSVIRSAFGVFTSRILGFLRDIFIAAVFGASALTDAFFVAFAIPNLFRALFAEGALSSAFVPILGSKLKKSEYEGYSYLSNMVIYLSSIIAIFIIIFSLFSDKIILLFMPGFIGDKEVISVASNILIIVMPYLLFVSVSALFSSFLNLRGSYFIPYSSTALLNLAMITSIYLSYIYSKNIYFLAWGVFFGGLIQLGYILLFSYKFGFKFSFDKKSISDVKKTFLLIVPSIFGVGINQLNFLVGRVLASYLPFGSISYLYYANRLFQFPFGLFSVTIGTVSLTELSKNDSIRRFEIISKSILSIFLIILPASLGLILLSDDIIRIVFQRNQFNFNDTVNTANALKMYSLGLLFFSLNMTFTKIFHSILDTKTPVKISAILLVSNIIFSLLLLKPFKHSGIALASSLSAFIGTIIYVKLISQKKLYSFKDFLSKYNWYILKIILSNFFMSIFVLYLYHKGVHVLLIILLTVIFYLIVLQIFKINFKEVLR